jgi:hypothetical protein
MREKMAKDEVNAPGWKTTELWLTAITGAISTFFSVFCTHTNDDDADYLFDDYRSDISCLQDYFQNCET